MGEEDTETLFDQQEQPEQPERKQGRGRKKTPIPQEIIDLLHSTYNTGKVGEINTYDDEYDREETERLLRLMGTYVNRDPHKRLRIQRDNGVIRFSMVDVKHMKRPRYYA